MENNISGYDSNAGQSIKNNYNQTVKKSRNPIVKILAIIGGIVVGFILLVVVMFLWVSSDSNKLVCKSSEGNITILYDDTTISGYTALGVSYDMNQQRAIANQIGIEKYISEFITWFETNTTGSCSIEEK